MKFKRKLLPIIVTFAIVCCLFGGIFGVDGTETQVARAEETISIYNQEIGEIDEELVYPDFVAFLNDLYELLGIGE